MHPIISLTSIILLFSFPVGGCGVLIGAGAAAGTASMEERGLSRAIDDKLIQAQINNQWLKFNSELFVDLSSEVYEGRVLLTGNVEKPNHRVDALRLAWGVDGVKEVINQIHVRDRSSLIDYARDVWVTTKLSVKLTIDSNIKAINYSIETVNGHVFIMGVAQNHSELDRVQAHAQDVSYVRKVTNYSLLKNDPSRGSKITVYPSAPAQK